MRPLKIILSVKPRRGNTLTEVFTRDIEENPFENGFCIRRRAGAICTDFQSHSAAL